MKFDDLIKQSLEDAPIPERLLPKNIAIMLKSKTGIEKSHRSAISVKTNKKVNLPIRAAAAVAAVIALALGLTTIFGGLNDRLPAGPKNSVGSGDIREAEDYSDVYKTIQDALVNNGTVLEHEFVSDNTPAIFPIERPGTAEKLPEKPAAPPQNSAAYKIPESANGADIIASDGTNLYYIADGALYMIAANGGKLSVISKNVHDNSSANSKYTGLFIDQNRLIAIGTVSSKVPFYAAVEPPATGSETTAPAVSSETGAPAQTAAADSETTTEAISETTPETTSGTASEMTAHTETTASDAAATVLQTNTFVDIYDLTDKSNIPLIYSYKQSGSPLYAQMLDGALYIATRYSGYQTKPLENREDLDNYVPAYYLGEEKHYIDAKDISLFAKSTGASYTVVAGISPQNAAPLTSIKAFLGGGNFVCAGASGLYIVGNDSTVADGSFAVRFALKNGSVSYGSNGGIAGLAQDSGYMSELDGRLRIVTISTGKSGTQTGNIFILDANMQIIGQLRNIPITKPASVRFDGKTCYIFGAEAAVAAVDLSDTAAPKLLENGAQGAYLYPFGEDRFLSLGENKGADGKSDGLKLTMYNSEKKELFTTKIAGELAGTKQLYLDRKHGIVGVPGMARGDYGTKNLYSLYAVGETEFVQKGVLEYNDIDPIFEFNRAAVLGDEVFYALSGGRIVAVQLEDFKVIDTILIS